MDKFGPVRFRRGPGRPVKLRSSTSASSAPAPESFQPNPNPVGNVASVRYPRLLQPLRWCRNGSIPDATFWKRAVDATNHVLAYRGKMFLSIGNVHGALLAGVGTVSLYRFRCATGWGTTAIRFDLGLLLDDKASALDPAVTVTVTKVNGEVAGTATAYYGANSSTPVTDGPAEISDQTLDVTVDPGTTYEVVIDLVGGGRLASVCAYEVHNPLIDERLNFYVEQSPTVWYPVLDINRSNVLRSLSETWLANGAHLLTYPGNGSGSAQSTGDIAWTNLIDDTTTISGSSAGFDISTLQGGVSEVPDLNPSRRARDATTVNVTFAVYGNTFFPGTSGSVQLADGNGTACSITVDSSFPVWTSVDTTIDVSNREKLDLQFRSNDPPFGFDVYAVSLYLRA